MYSREDTVKLLLSKKADPTASGGVRFSTFFQAYYLKFWRSEVLCTKVFWLSSFFFASNPWWILKWKWGWQISRFVYLHTGSTNSKGFFKIKKSSVKTLYYFEYFWAKLQIRISRQSVFTNSGQNGPDLSEMGPNWPTRLF